MAKILLSDDSSFMRKVLSDLLNKNGYTEIIEAENGKQAIEKFDAEKPDLVLLDIIMPELDGIGVLKDIVPKGGKAIVISAVGQDDIVEQAKAAGSQGYIVKPFEEAQVLEEIKKVLGSSTPTESSPAPTPEIAPTVTPTPEVAPVQPAPTPEVQVPQPEVNQEQPQQG
jgi:two-component system, chemotaxis family, chemotaxis protein CheY